MRTCQVTYVFLVGARFWYGVPCVDHNGKSGATFVFHIVMQIGNKSKCRSLLQTSIIMKSIFGSQKWIGSNCFTLCTSWFSRNRLFPLVCSLKDCIAYLHYKWRTIMAATVSKVSLSLFPRGKCETGTRKFHCNVLHNGDDDWLFLVCEVSCASYRPVGDSGRI